MLARALTLFLVTLQGPSCSHKKDSMNQKVDAQVSHSAQVLSAQLALPGPPVEVSFEQVSRGSEGGLGPTDRVLVALVRFDEKTLALLAKEAQPRPGTKISALANRPWFPAAVRSAITHVDDGTFSVRGRKFDAASLLKAPYATGYFVLVEGTDYVIISVQTS